MNRLDKSDIQGLLIRGYSGLPNAFFVFLNIKDPSLFKNWLSKTTFNNSENNPKVFALNIAFNADGLKTLGVPVSGTNGFSRAFMEGMDTDHRNRTLGDFHLNSYENWSWGSRKDKELQVLLMMYAKDPDILAEQYENLVNGFSENGINEPHPKIESHFLPGSKEHFGFKDGISQPIIRGLSQKAPEEDLINPGEFIFGYDNQYRKLVRQPNWANNQFGINGSYMVFRQLEQNVPLFWNQISEYTDEPGNPMKAIELASKMVGRRPNGQPLVVDDPITDPGKLNDFNFHAEDPGGLKCPLGSHIRRTNPRDSKSASPKKNSRLSAKKAVNNHRILRRGRTYGDALSPTMDIMELIEKSKSGNKGLRGLNFICFNTSIDRQFEFVQHTWINNRKFHEMYNDVDPIVGVNESKDQMAPTEFEVQAEPVRKRYHEIPAFVTLKGGSYFFMPGLAAIQYLGKM